MDRARALAGLNRKLLYEFSRRTIESLRPVLPLRLAIPHIEPFLALNVAKEARKDTLVIQRAGQALTSGSPAGKEAIRQLLEATKDIDRMFLARMDALPLRVVIRYDEIAPIRTQRIERLLGAAYRILNQWREGCGVRTAVQAAYSRPEFEQLLRGMLQLYGRETQLLSNSVQLPILLVPAREIIAQRLIAAMNDAAARLAGDLSRNLYRAQRRENAGPEPGNPI